MVEGLAPLFCFRASRALIESRLGPPLRRGVDSNGMGPMDGWRVEWPCGLEAFVWLFRADATGTPIKDEEPAYVEVHSASRDWCVRRQDENGNREVVGLYSSQCESDAIARALESRGHKQLYWVDRVD